MPETPEQLYLRAKHDLRIPPVRESDEWPFAGDVRPQALRPPLEAEPPLKGEGGIDCWRCDTPDEDFVWTSARWRVRVLGPTGLPTVATLEPRQHFALLGDLPADLDVLPTVPEAIWQADVETLRAALAE